MTSTILFYTILYYILGIFIIMAIRYYHHISSDEPLIKSSIWIYLLKAPIAPIVVILLFAILIYEDSSKFKKDTMTFLDKITTE